MIKTPTNRGQKQTYSKKKSNIIFDLNRLTHSNAKHDKRSVVSILASNNKSRESS